MERVRITAHNLTLHVQHWLQKPTEATLLHLFEHAINLIDADGEIISVVQPQIKPGPFSLVVTEKRPFSHLISPHAPVTKTATSLTIGPLAIDWLAADMWQPVPNWQQLRAHQASWRSVLPEMETAVNQHLDQLGKIGPPTFIEQFQTAVAQIQAVRFQENPNAWQTAVARLAGFGPGFTPAGDDFLVGFLFGFWATRPKNEVVELAKIVVETAVPRTTKLSAAWLEAAGRGEAWLPWHELVDALIARGDWQGPVKQILNQGGTSGLAALLGFIAAA